ncbi:MAG: hypothetical protein ACPHGY_09345, partial [Rhodospirillaceae bacterium]
TPLASRFLVAYLRHKAQDRRWQSFLGVLDAAPAMPELQCYYYRAKLATGDQETAFKGAVRLWISSLYVRSAGAMFEAFIPPISHTIT